MTTSLSNAFNLLAIDTSNQALQTNAVKMEEIWKRLPSELVLCVAEKAACNSDGAVSGPVVKIRQVAKDINRANGVRDAFQKVQAKSISRRALVANNFSDFKKLLFGLSDQEVGAATLITKTPTGHILNFPIASLQANLITLGYRIADFQRSNIDFSIRNFKIAFEMIPEGERSEHLCELERAVSSTPNTIAALRTSRSVAAVERGENIQTIAIDHGIASEEQIIALERIAVNGIAGERVRAGEDVQTIAIEHGITSENAINDLRLIDAEVQIANGHNVQEICAQYGITTPSSVTHLEWHAVIGSDFRAEVRTVGPAGAAALRGGNVQEICRQYGITTPRIVERLQKMSINPLAYA